MLWLLRVSASVAAGVAVYALLRHGFLFFPSLNWYIALPAAIWAAFTAYSPRAVALVLLTPLLVYRIVKALRRMEERMDGWDPESISYADDLVLLEEEPDEKSFIVAQAVRTVVKNATGREPRVVAIVPVSRDSAPSVYISSPDDALVGEDIEELVEDAVEEFLQKNKEVSLKLYELEGSEMLAVLIVTHRNYEELAKSMLEADYEGRVEVEGGSKLLEILYGIVRETVMQSSPEEVSRNKPLVAYLTVKQIDRLEKKGVIRLSGKAKSMLPLEDSKTRSIVRKQLQEEASDRRRKR